MENHQLNRNQDFYIYLYTYAHIYIYIYSVFIHSNRKLWNMVETWCKHFGNLMETIHGKWWKMRINNISNLGFQQQKVEYLLETSWGLSNITHLLLNVTLMNTGNAATGLGRFPRHRRSLIRGRTISIFDWNEWIHCMYIYIYPDFDSTGDLFILGWQQLSETTGVTFFFGYTITFPKLIWSRFCWSMPIINTVDGPAKSCTTKRIVGCLPSINWWISLAHPQYDVSCHAAVQKHPMWRVLPAFLHTRAAAGFCTASLTVESAGFSSDRPTGAAFLLGSTLKLVNWGSQKYLHLSTSKWTSDSLLPKLPLGLTGIADFTFALI